jgi:flagella basal body P-ring formation protein FlgA
VNNVKIPGVSEQEGIDVKMIMEAIDAGLEGRIVDVKTGNGDIVEVTIE